MKKTLILLFSLLALNSSIGQNRLYDSLRYQLYIMENADQEPRIQMDSLAQKYGADTSLLMDQKNKLWKKMKYSDSLNLIKVAAIIDQFGWLGADDVGDDGSTTLFIVIQHADLKTQEKYLPIMKDAVSKGNAKARNLAILEDRIALREGKKQIYGSQILYDLKSNEHFVLPIEDPEHVDIRRARVGLQPLSDYLVNFHMKWDLAKYYADLSYVEAKLKANPL